MNSIIVLWASLIVALVLLGTVMAKSFKSKGKARTFFLILGIVLAIYAVLGFAGNYGLVNLGQASGIYFATTGVSTTTTTNPTVTPTTSANSFVIGTLKASAKEEYSNSYGNVGSGSTSGGLKIFDAGTTPSSPTASTIDRVNMSAGSGSSTNKLVKTNTPYRVVYDGGNTWYDKDFGVMTFDSNAYNAETSELLFDVGTITKIATIDDMLTEIHSTNGDVNGEANSSARAMELYGDASDSLVYNESAGDAQFYIKPTISFSGAYTGVKLPVLCFQWDVSNPPEGNEITSITAQLVSGTDFGIPSELVNYWSTQQCVMLGSQATAGQSEQVKLTFTVVEANMDTTDDWYLYLDDLGKAKGNDQIISNTGATADSIKFDDYTD